MTNNEVKIKGRAYRYTVAYTKTGKTISTFGLQFYNGKDTEGKSKYAFVNCKCFSDLKLQDKQDVIVCGNLACDEWTDKNGAKQSRIVILVNNIITDKEPEAFSDDSMPF